ncbi:hypothetical protein RRG08_066408 [Elysia crispata]|uniref:Uncharacterized protein n=1 Tax=Elysia crispata TaxID=231223 RepID=A0AAE1E622_9GAST|nr:hypothetical protein RRG08_066408 [Elysia crispata]
MQVIFFNVTSRKSAEYAGDFSNVTSRKSAEYAGDFSNVTSRKSAEYAGDFSNVTSRNVTGNVSLQSKWVENCLMFSMVTCLRVGAIKCRLVKCATTQCHRKGVSTEQSGCYKVSTGEMCYNPVSQERRLYRASGLRTA